MSLIKINLKEKKTTQAGDIEEIQKAQIQISKPKNFNDFLNVLKTQFDNANSDNLKVYALNQNGDNIEIKDDTTFSKENYLEFTIVKDNKKLINYDEERIYEEFNERYYLEGLMEKEEFIKKYYELNGNREALEEWIQSYM